MPDLEWKATAIADLLAIVDYISDDNPAAAQTLKDEIENKASKLPGHPMMYRVGRTDGTREMVVRRNYIVVYAEDPGTVTILRVLHAAQQWPGQQAVSGDPYRRFCHNRVGLTQPDSFSDFQRESRAVCVVNRPGIRLSCLVALHILGDHAVLGGGAG